MMMKFFFFVKKTSHVTLIGSFYLESSNQIFSFLPEKTFRLPLALYRAFFFTSNLPLSLSLSIRHTHSLSHPHTLRHTLYLSVWSKEKKSGVGLVCQLEWASRGLSCRPGKLIPLIFRQKSDFDVGTKIKIEILRSTTMIGPILIRRWSK